MKFSRYIPSLLLMLPVMVLFACRKTDRDNDTTIFATRDNILAEHLFSDIFKQVHAVAVESELLNDTSGNNAFDTCLDTVMFSPSSGVFPVTVTLDYGKGGSVSCQDGKTRKGKIIAVFTKKYFNNGLNVTINLQDYVADDISIGGKTTLVNNGLSAQGQTVFAVSSDLSIHSDTLSIEWEAGRECTWIAGEGSVLLGDDVFSITGKSTGRSSKGSKFSSEITAALEGKYSCNWISSGVIKVYPDNLQPRIADFGSGCDNVVEVKIGLEEVTLELP